MKQIMKRVLLVLCMVTCLFSLSACGKAEDAASTVDAEMASMLENLSSQTLQQFATLTDDQIATSITQSEKEGNSILAGGLESWMAVKDEVGAFVSITSTEIEEAEDGYLIKINAVFEKRQMEFTMGVNEEVSNYTSISFNPVYSRGERLQKAALNTLMGMGTVFLVLIFISLIIACFKYIGVLERKMADNNTAAPAPAQEPVVTVPVAEENLADDLELVAVITAAIAASTGSSADGLVVRSIRRASGAKWKKA